MSTIGLVGAEQREFVGAFAQLFDPDDPNGVGMFRRNLVAGATSLVSPDPSAAEVAIIPAAEGRPDLRVLIHRPEAGTGPVPVVLYLHGGGLLAGNPDMMVGASDRIARETGTVVVAPDYRLAPEHRFPAALEDAYGALIWIRDNAAQLGIAPDRISVMGDSAGGLLSAGVALLARDRGEVRLRAQFLLYPMLDHRTGSDAAVSDDPLTGEFVWTRPRTAAAWRLSASEDSPTGPAVGYRSPAVAEDLANLPPTYLVVAGLDLLRDEAIAYGQRLMRAGVAVDLVVYAGAVHAFDVLPGELSRRARAHLLEAIRRLG